MILLIMKIFCILTVPISVFYVWYFTTFLQDVIIEENQAMVQGSTSFLTAAHDSTIISKSKFNIKNSEAFKIIRTQKVLFITVQLYISIFLNIKRNSYLVEKKKNPRKTTSCALRRARKKVSEKFCWGLPWLLLSRISVWFSRPLYCFH